MDRIVARQGLGSLVRPVTRLPCSSCRQLQQRRQYPGTAKPYYVTTPIFYVNADPHVGHLYSMVLADVLKRWQQLKGRQALLCTGTDEHGLKVQQAAARAGVAPQQFCDETSAVFSDLAKRARISHDFFVRTTDEDHKTAVRSIWRRLRRRGYIYQTKHAGWYCVSDETFYPEKMVEKRISTTTGRVEMVATETGKTVEWTEEINYHFRMTAVRDKLLKLYQLRPDFVVPEARMAEVERWVQHNLEDLSISRPASRLSWGIPVPDDKSQTVYVWVDALVNYLAKAGYPERWAPEEAAEALVEAAEVVTGGSIRRVSSAEAEMGSDTEAGSERPERPQEAEAAREPEAVPGSGKAREEQLRHEGGGWPADVHVLGKDIVRFHAVYWPALLLALELPLPKQLLTHAHWTLGRKKMSKSDGNVVNPFYAMDRFGIDALRYYLVHDGGLQLDAAYGNEHIAERYHKGLQGGVGNLLGRVMRSKRWNVREAVERSVADMHETTGPEHKAMDYADESYAQQAAAIDSTGDRASKCMDVLDLRSALHAVMDLVYQTNKFLQSTTPWLLAKDERPDAQLRLGQIVFLAAESLRVAGILLQPVMPDKAAEMLDVLGVPADRRTFADARLGADGSYGVPLRSPGKGSYDGLFPPLPVED